jgi:hypothetical protein
MANTPESIAVLWKNLEEKKVAISPDVWGLWQEGCVKELAGIREIIERSHGGAIPAADAEMVGKKAYFVQKFVRSIKRSPDDGNRFQDGHLIMEGNVRELVAHYIGNDLYKISLMADLYGVNPDPLPPENGALILKNINAIMEFIELLKTKTGQTA